jgi:gas vesicle protein
MEMSKKHTLIALVAVILFAGFSYAIYSYNKNKDKNLNDNENNNNVTETNKPLTYLSISINPDVELAVNDTGAVEEVVPINEDADVITSDLNLVGTSVEDASEKIVDAAIDTGYIDEYSDNNTVVLTTANEDETTRESIESKVLARLNQHFEQRKIYPVLVANGLSDELKADAKTYGVSNGKMLLIDRAVAINPTLKKEDLAKMTVKDIQAEIKTYVTARHDALKQTREQLKTTWQQKKAALKTTYQSKVNTLKNQLLTNAGYNVTTMTQAQKDAAAKALLQTKKQQIKTKVNQIKEEVKNTIQSTTGATIKERIQNIRERINQKTNQ